MPNKVKVTIDGVPLAGKAPIVWKLTTGTQPYRTVMQVHKDDWGRLKGKLGKNVTIRVQPAHDKPTSIRGVTILHQVASDSPARVSFVVADARWRLPYVLIAKDFNITKRSGEKSNFYDKVPIENAVTFDQFTFKWYSLKLGTWKWTAQEALEHVLTRLYENAHEHDGGRWFVESFPVDEEFTLQNVALRDFGDAALARLLSYIPRAECYVDIDGLLRIFNAGDAKATEREYKKLNKLATYDGDKVVKIKYSGIRPKKTRVHFTRLFEMLTEYDDDWSKVTEGSAGGDDEGGGGPGVGLYEDLDPNEPWLMNVIPTVDYQTQVLDGWTPPSTPGGSWIQRTSKVLKGTWLPSDQWVKSMNLDGVRPEGSLPWNWETIKRHWFKGDLEGVLAGAGNRGIPDLAENADWAARVAAFRQHFRQTFQINPRYIDRLRDLTPQRVGPWDPTTGAAAHSPVWGDHCIIPSVKGHNIAARRDKERTGVWTNVQALPASYDSASFNIDAFTSHPGRIEIIDRDLGIFRVNWLRNPFGTVDSIIPSRMVDKDGENAVPLRALRHQKTKTVSPGAQIQNGTNGIFLSDTMTLRALITATPAAPNNELQFHVVELDNSDVDVFTDLTIDSGEGPELELFVPPGESMARIQWGSRSSNDDGSKRTVRDMLGVDFDDPTVEGLLPGVGYPNLTLTNEEKELKPVAKAWAAEYLAAFQDEYQGRIASEKPKAPLLRGNMSDVTVSVGAYPSGKVQQSSTFPGVARATSRFALMSDDVRKIVLGIVDLKPR